jgi:hypothetical protein
MIAVGEASYIVAGLEKWEINQRQQTFEPRLQRALRVSRLYLPPAADSRHGAALRRFPEFYSCQKCTTLQRYGAFGVRGSECRCGGALIPSRFVIACEDGHIDDFPYRFWAHRGTDTGGRCGKALKMVTTGRTASLRSIEIVCECGAKVSMEGAFRRRELRKLGVRCLGARPWLGEGPNPGSCDKAPRTLQRGSSAAWFGIVRSSLAIPPWSTQVQKLIEPFYTMWKAEQDEVIARQAASAGLTNNKITAQHVVDAVRRRRALETPPDADAEADDLDVELRTDEYDQLCSPSADQTSDDFECRPAAGVPVPELSQVMLVDRLREVRVLESFTRVDQPSAADPATRRAALSAGPIDWLPAMEVRGEGVFLRFSEQPLQDWETIEGVRDRARRIRDNHQRLLDRRAENTGRPAPRSQVTARSLMIHTLAHVLIDEWSLEAGYPASAMRERLYTHKGMAGLLIYTATSDSAGSLGGIVSQGEPERLARTLRSALLRATWCSADPLCMETQAAGTESMNLAACHVCCLLPETSCEHGNTLLDRALLIGRPDSPQLGYFNRHVAPTI